MSHPRTTARRIAALAAFPAALALLAAPPVAGAEESNPNNYTCAGQIGPGAAEPGNEEQQVSYAFYCNGPITGYQLQSQVQVTGISSPPTLTTYAGQPLKAPFLSDNFSCSGDIPGYAVNCVGIAKGGYERISGQFAISSKLCVEPRVDPLLTVTYAYLEKGVVTQAISGPFDLGRPSGCKPDAFSGGTRLNPKTPAHAHAKHARKHKKHKH
ncbi:MAG TPA: hypothetical protein VH137_05785 [Gemmatimonadales bacterium]|nr:hypothetical protein [Gemmatimonadales bacterium]